MILAENHPLHHKKYYERKSNVREQGPVLRSLNRHSASEDNPTLYGSKRQEEIVTMEAVRVEGVPNRNHLSLRNRKRDDMRQES